MRMYRLFLFLMEAVLNDAAAIMLQYRVAFAKARIVDTVDDVVLSRYLPRQWRFTYLLSVRHARLKTASAVMLPLLEALNDGFENGNEPGISYPDNEFLHATGNSFVVLRILRTTSR